MNMFHTANLASGPCKALTITRRRLGIFWRLAAFMGLIALCPDYGSAAQYTITSVPNVQLQDASRFVSNPDAIISAAHELQINRLAGELRSQSGIELAVVAVKDIGDMDARQFANELFQHWGLGKEGKDNGLLILLVTQPPQRSIVFETGYGLEAYLPDALCYRMQQEHMIPLLKKNEYSLAMLKGVTAVGEHFFSGEYKNVQSEKKDSKGFLENFLLLLLTCLTLFLMMFLSFKFTIWLGGVLGSFFGYFCGGRGSSDDSSGWGSSSGGSSDRRSSSDWGSSSSDSGGGSGGGSWGGGSSGGGGSSSRF